MSRTDVICFAICSPLSLATSHLAAENPNKAWGSWGQLTKDIYGCALAYSGQILGGYIHIWISSCMFCLKGWIRQCPVEHYFWLGDGYLRLIMTLNMFQLILDIQEFEGDPTDYQIQFNNTM